MPVVPYYLGRPAQVWIAAMSGRARATTENSCAATSLATGTFPASPRPAVPTAQRKTQEEASPRSHGRNRQRLGGLGKSLVHPRAAAPSVLTATDRAREEAAIDGDGAGMESRITLRRTGARGIARAACRTVQRGRVALAGGAGRRAGAGRG